MIRMKVNNIQNIKEQQRIAYRLSMFFTLMSALLIALSPQFFGGIFALIFIIPVYMGISGIKYRKKSGWLLGLGIAPIAASVAILWIRYIWSILPNFDAAIIEVSSNVNVSFSTIKFLSLCGFIFSIIMLVLVCLTIVGLIKYRSVFENKK
jgi:hypothetical protein